MSVLNQIAFYQARRDELPNQVLARKLVDARNFVGIREIADNLSNQEPAVQSDCLKVLYEAGYLAPELIADYVLEFLRLLEHRNNRMVWGAMIALSTIAPLCADQIFPHVTEIIHVMQAGSVITVDNGVKTLALVAAQDARYRKSIFPYLLEHLAACRLKEVPQHAEKVLPAVTSENKSEFILLLEQRLEGMSASQAARVRKVIKLAEKR